MRASRRSPKGEPLFSPNDIARLFQLVSDLAYRGHLDPSEVIEWLEHGIIAPAPTVVNPTQLTEQDLEMFFDPDRQ